MELDPASLAQGLSTVVGLICNFRQERGSAEALDHRKFIEWLEYHRHEEIKNLILRTHNLPREIDDLLRRDQTEILRRLAALDEVFATVLSRLEGFSGLVGALAPGAGISEQAMKILVSFAESDADLLILMDIQGQPVLCFAPGTGKDIEEPRFLPDDLNTLAAYGLFSTEFGENPMFRLTRNGAKYAKLLKEQGVVGGL